MARPKRSKQVIDQYMNEVAAEMKPAEIVVLNDKPASIIKPLIKVKGEKNLLEEMFDEDAYEDLPELTAVGFFNLNKGRHTWISYKIVTKGDRVLSIEPSEPDMRAIAYEAAKIEFEESLGKVTE